MRNRFLKMNKYGNGGSLKDGTVLGVGGSMLTSLGTETSNPLLIGAGMFATTASSVIADNANMKEEERLNLLAKENQIRTEGAANNNFLSTYPTKGVKGANLYKYGGYLKNIVPNVTEVVGAKHEQGGVKIGNKEEVEGGEIIYKNKVFSKRTGFADRAKEIISKLDDKTLNEATRGTYERNLDKLHKEQSLFNDINNIKEGQEMKYGGLLNKKRPAAPNMTSKPITNQFETDLNNNPYYYNYMINDLNSRDLSGTSEDFKKRLAKATEYEEQRRQLNFEILDIERNFDNKIIGKRPNYYPDKEPVENTTDYSKINNIKPNFENNPNDGNSILLKNNLLNNPQNNSNSNISNNNTVTKLNTTLNSNKSIVANPNYTEDRPDAFNSETNPFLKKKLLLSSSGATNAYDNTLSKYYEPLDFNKNITTTAPEVKPTGVPTGSYVDGSYAENNPKTEEKETSKLNIGSQFLDNAINFYLTKNTPQLPNQNLTSPARLETKVNIDSQLNELDNNFNAFSKNLERTSTDNSGVLSNKQAAFSSLLKGRNAMYANKFNTETQLKNNQAVNNQETEARNNAITYDNQFKQVLRKSDMQDRYSKNVANLAEDIKFANIDKQQEAADNVEINNFIKALDKKGVVSRNWSDEELEAEGLTKSQIKLYRKRYAK